MNRLNEQKLLREYVRRILLEYEGMGSYDSTGMGYGWGASQADLMNTFITPFTDVVKVAVGSVKEVTRRARTLVRVAFETVMTTILPFVKDSYDDIFKQEEADINAIRSEYKDAFDRTTKTFGNIETMAFFMAPGPFLLAQVGSKAPNAIASTLSVATGGLTDKVLPPNRSGGKSESRFRRGSILKEEDEEGFEEKLKKVLKDPKVQAAMKSNIGPIAKQLKAAKKKKLEAALEMARSVLTAKSAGDLEKALGDKSKIDAAKKKVLASKDSKDISPEELDKIFNELPKKSMEFMKSTFLLPLEKELDALKKGDGDPELIKDYSKTIAAIKSL
jgi:hypothetical protein